MVRILEGGLRKESIGWERGCDGLHIARDNKVIDCGSKNNISS